MTHPDPFTSNTAMDKIMSEIESFDIDEDGFCPGDCKAVHLGDIELKDGRRFRGVILTFPNGPPSIPIAAIWDELPLTLKLRDEAKP